MIEEVAATGLTVVCLVTESLFVDVTLSTVVRTSMESSEVEAIRLVEGGRCTTVVPYSSRDMLLVIVLETGADVKALSTGVRTSFTESAVEVMRFVEGAGCTSVVPYFSGDMLLVILLEEAAA